MARRARRDIVDENKVQVFHGISRCVRRAFLCGQDDYSGKNYDHRRQWIEDLTIRLAKYFALDIIAVAILSNHMHHILRTRPDLVRGWSNEEVARRWLGIFPKRFDDEGQPCEPTTEDIQRLAGNKKRIKVLRERLSNISWFMRRLKEQVARCANQEDETDGRFFAGRFKSIRLDDESAILAAAVYVDLNVIRAGLALTPEDSCHTSIKHRIVAFTARRRPKRGRGKRAPSRQDPAADRWLAPLFDRHLPTPQRTAAAGHRASDNAGIAITESQYIQLVDWTGRQQKRKTRGVIPAELAPIMSRLQIDTREWCDGVLEFSRWARRVVGVPGTMQRQAEQFGQHWLQGIARCRQIFSSPGKPSKNS